MHDPTLLLKYDGGDADKHLIDSKLFGQSIQGLDRLVSDCLIALSTSRPPRRGERSPVRIKARELTAGSVNVPQVMQDAATTLGIGLPILQAIGPEIVGHYISAVLDYFRGEESSMENTLQKIVEMHKNSLDSLQASQETSSEIIKQSEAHRHTETLAMTNLLRVLVINSGTAAKDYVAPIGHSVHRSTITTGTLPPIVTTEDDAHAIRESQSLEWDPPALLSLKTDGFKFHSNGLSVENPEGEGYMMAEVQDPAFESESNPYTVAAAKRASIETLARKGYKNNKLRRILILHFIRETVNAPMTLP